MSTTVIWALLGLALLGAEVVTSTFILLFFGIAALVVAMARVLGLDNITAELLLFSAIGLLGVALLRKKIAARMGKKHQGYEIDRASAFRLDATVPAHGEAHVSYQGSRYTAVNESDASLPEGTRVIVTRVEGIKIYVKKSETEHT